MKYIFVAGAPGSKWSSVVKNIYYSASIDQSDYRDDWTYYHDASGKKELMHLGAYFDPGMACALPEYFNAMSKFQAEQIFNQPFANESIGIRIIKSHVFSYPENIQYLKQHWPESPVVLVYRSDDACLGWWVKCGHFDITYPDYAEYYKNLREMGFKIQKQNQGILDAADQYAGTEVGTNQQLAQVLRLETPPLTYVQDYAANDIKVTVI